MRQAAIGDVGLLYGDWDTIAVLRIVHGVHCINLTTHISWELRLDIDDLRKRVRAVRVHLQDCQRVYEREVQEAKAERVK